MDASADAGLTQVNDFEFDRITVKQIEEALSAKADPLIMTSAEQWQRGAKDAAEGQPCDEGKPDAYQEGWRWFHTNETAMMMSRRIGAVADHASKSAKALVEFQQNNITLRQAYEAGWRARPQDYERVGELDKKFQEFIKSNILP